MIRDRVSDRNKHVAINCPHIVVRVIFKPVGIIITNVAFCFVGLLKMSPNNSYFYGAIVTIIAIHIFLAIFIYAAVTEGSKPARKVD